MVSREDQEHRTKAPSKQGDGDSGTRSGRPNPEDVPSHPEEHQSGYGGKGGSPRTSTEQRETPKKT